MSRLDTLTDARLAEAIGIMVRVSRHMLHLATDFGPTPCSLLYQWHDDLCTACEILCPGLEEKISP
jgi:hypothetical protein